METETFECSHKRSFASRDGGGKYSIYITKDDGTEMTVYGEAIGAEGWQKGARLKITAQPARQSKNGKWYQTATSVELLGGEVAVPNGATPTATVSKDPDAQWKEKYRLTMSNLISAWLSSGKELKPETHTHLDLVVRDILEAKKNSNEKKADDFDDQF